MMLVDETRLYSLQQLADAKTHAGKRRRSAFWVACRAYLVRYSA